jgi:hypothetical protein
MNEVRKMMIALFFMAVMGVVFTIGGIVSALVWFANTAEDECVKRRERYTRAEVHNAENTL